MTILTKALLTKINAKPTLISFFERSKLLGLPVLWFDQVTGDYKGRVEFLRNHAFVSDTEIRYECSDSGSNRPRSRMYTYDDRNNMIKEEQPTASIVLTGN